MSEVLPIIGITMGDPVGVGPEIIVKTMADSEIHKICRPLIIGDYNVLKKAEKYTQLVLKINLINHYREARFKKDWPDLLALSALNAEKLVPGKPTAVTGQAMVDYIETCIDLSLKGKIDGMVTAPINKKALKLAGCNFAGHTEILAHRTKTAEYVMMLAGKQLRVALVTIHVPLKEVAGLISTLLIIKTIRITALALKNRFGITKPRLAVAGLNPHAGEAGLFGDEETRIILPAITKAQKEGFDVQGPFPPDTIFYKATKGEFDAIICMYHDQGLIPFKLLHFIDGVNTTLGLPIIRTSVDHGTAYDIAGSGTANQASLIAAIKMAANQAVQRNQNKI